MIGDIIAALSSLGGLGGLAAAITAVCALRRRDDDMSAVRAAVEPNHGSSLADSMRRTEAQVMTLTSRVESLDHRIGHEMGDMRRAADATHAGHDAIHADHAARIRHLEEHHC